MKRFILERLLDCIGGVEDIFLAEAETVGVVRAKADRRKQIAKYGAYGAAGLAVSVGMTVAFLKIRSNRIAKSA